MKRPEPDSPEARQRAFAAAEWLVKRDRGFTPGEQDEFLQWLAADPRHGEWFALQRGTVANFSCLAQWRPEHSEEPNPDLLAPPRRRLRWLLPAGLAAAASLAVTFIWWQSAAPTVGDAPAITTDYERRILEDGSTVELNRGAVVNVMFTLGERRVALERGEALFTVAKDLARPFIVRAGGVDVRAVGTVFNVRLAAAEVEVLVTEGRVAIRPPVDLRSSSSAPRDPDPEIVAGQRATVPLAAAAAPEIVSVSAEETARLLAWQPQLLDFSSAPLERAIAEFNRRNRVQFVLADPELAALPIVAAIRSDNTDGFTRFLAATPGLQVERRGENEIVVRRKP